MSRVGAVLLAAVALGSGPAHAQLAGRLQGGAGFGDGYGGMVGGSIGLEFPLLFGQPAYVGPWAMYNAGGTVELDGEAFDQRSTFLGIEGGGVFLERPFLIRGSGNIAAALITNDRVGGEETITETRLDLSGGVAFGYQLGRWFVAAEPYTFLIVSSDTMGSSFNLFLTVGYRPENQKRKD